MVITTGFVKRTKLNTGLHYIVKGKLNSPLPHIFTNQATLQKPMHDFKLLSLSLSHKAA
jgi:hypothetical protein